MYPHLKFNDLYDEMKKELNKNFALKYQYKLYTKTLFFLYNCFYSTILLNLDMLIVYERILLWHSKVLIIIYSIL